MKSETYEFVGPIYMRIEGQSLPAPEVLTEEEVIQLLRLDIDGPGDAKHTLQYYRDQGLLRATRIGKRLRYWRREILRFLERKTEMTNTQVED
jgi:hypothetical protein